MSPQELQTLERDCLSPATQTSAQALRGFSMGQTKAIEQELSMIFHGKEEESQVAKARRILGKSVEGMLDEELESMVSGIQYLIECWMDSFERNVFNNLTLNQVVKGE